MVLLNAITLSMALFCQQEEPMPAPVPVPSPPPAVWDLLQSKYDANLDSKISAKEHGRGEIAFVNLDVDGDGFITQDDFKAPALGANERSLMRKLNGRKKRTAPPKIGEVAPDFELQLLVHEEKSPKPVREVLPLEEKGKAKDLKDTEQVKTVRLSSFAGKKPVALIFGSYT